MSLMDSDPPGFIEFPPSTTVMHAWAPHGHSLGSTSPLRSQTTQSHPTTHVPEPQTTPGYFDLPRTSLPAFPNHPLPAHFASESLHTRYNSFPGQYVMHSYVPPFQNQPSQPHVYRAYHPQESNPYSPSQYYPPPPLPPLPYLRHEVRVQGGHPYYQHVQRPPLPMSQSVTSVPGPSHAGSFGGTQQYQPLPYSSTGHFGLTQQYQRSVHQWYYGRSSSSADTFPTQPQQYYPINYLHPRSQRLHRDSNMLSVQPTDSKHLPSPSLGPSTSSIILTTSRNAISPPTADSLEQKIVRGSPKIDTREPSNRLAASTSRAHDHPLVRRHYHPNPPRNRSEWVMWVGNVPSDATHDELWQFLKSSVLVSSGSKYSGGVEDSGVVSLFLISRSNCAFVNYNSKERLNHAITQFNGRQLRPDDRRCPWLVCRARRKEDDLRAGVGAQRGIGIHTRHVKNLTQKDNELAGGRTTLSKGHRSSVMMSDPPPAPPTSRDEETSQSDTVEGVILKVPTRSSSSYASTTSSFLMCHFPKRFFILKSLTKYDLDLSVERGMWATQQHNEAMLDQAFRTSKEVFLIFSVNKSSEFYGYARMASGILRSSYNISWAPRADPSPRTSSPLSSCLPSHGTLEQHEIPSRQSPEIYTLPSESRLAEVTPFPVAPSSEETEDRPTAAGSPRVGSAQERRSALPALHRAFEDPPGPDPHLRSSFSSSHKGWPVTFQVSQDPDPSSVLQPELGKDLGVGAGAKSKRGGVDDAGSLGSHLQPVMEEVRGGSGVERDVQAASTAVRSEAMPGRSEVQQGEASWGETFKIEWLRTERVPFYRTRHLRNPWNHDRDIKVARDGTEIEPTIGQQLIDEWPALARAAGRRGGQSVVATSGEPKGVKIHANHEYDK